MNAPAHARIRSLVVASVLAALALLAGACSDDGGGDKTDLSSLPDGSCPDAIAEVVGASKGSVEVTPSTDVISDPEKIGDRTAVEAAGGGVIIDCEGSKGSALVAVADGKGAAALLAPATQAAAELTVDEVRSLLDDAQHGDATPVGDDEGVALGTFDVDGAGSAAVLITDGGDDATHLADQVADALDGYRLGGG